jgi:hypothetical protein
MKAIGRIVFVVIAVGLVIGSPVTAQIKNPIQAAKDAFKKAREEEEAKRAQRPPRPQAPTPAPASPAAPGATTAAAGAASAECCSPEALSKLAASVGFVDIVGVKLGMTLEQAVAALKAANPKFAIDVHDGELMAGGKVTRRPHVILAHLPAASRNPAIWANLDGSSDSIWLQLSTPPGPMVVEVVMRYVSFPSSAPVAAGTLVEAHRTKYGQESLDDSGQALGWIYDLTGKLLRNPNQAQISCLGWRPHVNSGDIRSGDGSNEPGRTIPGLESLATPAVYDQNSAKCASYVVVRAEIQHTSPTQLEGAFWTTIHSPGLQRNSLALTEAFVKQANENAIKQQEDAGAKRAAPKL